MGRVDQSRRPSRSAVVVSCEHASHRLPARYGLLGLPRARLRSHISWDRGASNIAQSCARALDCPHHAGSYSRLLIDLNRSPHHPRLIPRVAFGVPIPGNQDLSPGERRWRIERYYEPYRLAVLDSIEAAISQHRHCLHLSVHTFVPKLANQVRRADVGLLYDPGRRAELRAVDRLRAELKALGLQVRRNYPYRGTSDGFTACCRRIWPDAVYAGVEIEVNQRVLRTGAATEKASREIGEAVGLALA